MIDQMLTALQGFFGGFGIPCYPEDSVPDFDALGNRVRPPYITVKLVCPTWRATVPFFARVWYRSNTYAELSATVSAIAEAIGEGESIPCETGAIYIFKGRSFCELIPYPGDPTLKCAYLSMNMMAHIG